ncbi:DNA topoisomerase IB [Methylobacillus caricis]|uniref:DNA topoisomerase IB n=1 Tax=Methylobacillus caricis TaxID=1971611 RepID=UPI001CFF901D|nr:DNA topoisomerase IB [Methylobacillus caricis]MCB5187497.1 DNA topoisomerase IB [Methylobacillus caricis]
MANAAIDGAIAQGNASLCKDLHIDMELSAQAARLRYINDRIAGITRKRSVKGFRYMDTHGRPLRDNQHLNRIKALAIPPAWTNVWICPYANGHLQATGYDAKGRKQYRYHKSWRVIRDEAKYGHIVDFALHLPLIRKQVNTDLARPGLCMEKILALVVTLLEKTMIRIGNDEYARINRSFGITTLRNRHVDVHAGQIVFHFQGKSRVEHTITLQNANLARIVRKMKDLPGQELFQYVDETGHRHSISSSDVNQYLKNITGSEYTAKDFRTWSGAIHAFEALISAEAFENQTQAKKNVTEAIAVVAEKLGNTPAICRKCYVHPFIIKTYLAGGIFDHVRDDASSLNKSSKPWALNPVEQQVLKLLQSQDINK